MDGQTVTEVESIFLSTGESIMMLFSLFFFLCIYLGRLVRSHQLNIFCLISTKITMPYIRIRLIHLFFFLLFPLSDYLFTEGFLLSPHHGRLAPPRRTTSSSLDDTAQVENYLKENYSGFFELLLEKNKSLWKKLSDAEDGYTIFAPTNQAFQKLGEKRIGQLRDIRNSETAEKMGAYHAVNEPVSSEELFAAGGVKTLGGVVDVGRSVTGGLFGIGGKEDGGVTINGASITGCTKVGDCIIHEVDELISPKLLWRYCDQLRIPGSK